MKIRKWEVWQSYRKDRGQPPWIKVHRTLMRDPDWVALTDAQRGQLVSIWMLAADHNGQIPPDPKIIQKLCFMEKEPDLKTLIEHGFIEGRRRPDANMTTARRRSDQPETEESRDREETEAEEKNAAVAALVPEDLKVSLPEISDWLAYKREKGQTYRPKGLEALWRAFRQIPVEKRRASVDHSMSQNWAGLFLKDGGSHGSRSTAGYAEPKPGKYQD